LFERRNDTMPELFARVWLFITESLEFVKDAIFVMSFKQKLFYSLLAGIFLALLAFFLLNVKSNPPKDLVVYNKELKEAIDKTHLEIAQVKPPENITTLVESSGPILKSEVFMTSNLDCWSFEVVVDKNWLSGDQGLSYVSDIRKTSAETCP